jgi:hypothetical protein
MQNVPILFRSSFVLLAQPSAWRGGELGWREGLKGVIQFQDSKTEGAAVKNEK